MSLAHSTLTAGPVLRCLATAAAALVFSGCAHVYVVKVEALRTPENAPRRTYRIVDTAPAPELVDPLLLNATAAVERALEAHGMHAASRPEWADVAIEVGCSIGPQHLKSVPDPAGDAAGAVGIFYPDRSGGNLGESTGTYVPTAALKRVVAVREKALTVVAHENTIGMNSPSDTGAELWRVEVAIEDPGADIETLLPILAAAMVDYIDADSDPACVKRVSENAPGVILVSQNP